MDSIQGMVYLVGAGPGDESLITRHALDCLFQCDAVVYDYLASDNLLKEVRPGCEKIYVGKRAGFHSKRQEEINDILIGLAMEGKRVVRLKGGDPMVFGRGGEEVLALQKAGIAYQVVPGVTSAVAALTSAGIPVTHRGISRSFHVMTGHVMGVDGSLPEDFEHFARLEGTLVFLMGLNNLNQITEGLMACGKAPDTPAAVIENGTLPGQRVVRSVLKDLTEAVKSEGLHSPAIIVVGQVAAFHMESKEFRKLYGVKTGLVGTEAFMKKLSDGLNAQGAQASRLLCMELTEPDTQKLETAMNNLPRYTWLVFTSSNGVRLFFGKLLSMGKDYRAIGHMKLAVIGKGTAEELMKYGFRADFIPEVYCSEALGKGLSDMLSPNDCVLIPRAAKGSQELTEILGKKGICYDDVILYDTSHHCDDSEELMRKIEDCRYLIFGSGSGVDALAQVLGNEGLALPGIKIACIGDITARRLAGYGRKPDIVADQFSVKGLVEAICKDTCTRN